MRKAKAVYRKKPDVQWYRTDSTGKTVTVQVFVPIAPKRKAKRCRT